MRVVTHAADRERSPSPLRMTASSATDFSVIRTPPAPLGGEPRPLTAGPRLALLRPAVDPLRAATRADDWCVVPIPGTGRARAPMGPGGGTAGARGRGGGSAPGCRGGGSDHLKRPTPEALLGVIGAPAAPSPPGASTGLGSPPPKQGSLAEAARLCRVGATFLSGRAPFPEPPAHCWGDETHATGVGLGQRERFPMIRSSGV